MSRAVNTSRANLWDLGTEVQPCFISLENAQKQDADGNPPPPQPPNLKRSSSICLKLYPMARLLVRTVFCKSEAGIIVFSFTAPRTRIEPDAGRRHSTRTNARSAHSGFTTPSTIPCYSVSLQGNQYMQLRRTLDLHMHQVPSRSPRYLSAHRMKCDSYTAVTLERLAFCGPVNHRTCLCDSQQLQ